MNIGVDDAISEQQNLKGIAKMRREAQEDGCRNVDDDAAQRKLQITKKENKTCSNQNSHSDFVVECDVNGHGARHWREPTSDAVPCRPTYTPQYQKHKRVIRKAYVLRRV